MESDRCVVVREANKISIVNTKNKNVTPLNVQVDSSIMNPSTNVLGLRGIYDVFLVSCFYFFLFLFVFSFSRMSCVVFCHFLFFGFFRFSKNKTTNKIINS